MRIVATSDLHGHLPEVPECDVLCIAGDLCPTFGHDFATQNKWLHGPFADWLRRIPARHIVGCWGNHDFIGQEAPEAVADLPWILLNDAYRDIDGVRFYGTPWQPVFFDWAFNLTEPGLAKKFALIDKQTDVLISHGPPWGLGDKTQRGESVGSMSLLTQISLLKIPLTFCGHIHEAYGAYTIGGSPSQVYNVSLVNSKYKPAHKLVEVEYARNRRPARN